MSKYRNEKATYNGTTFDSKRERDRYCDLLLLERAGRIHDLRLQVPYVVIPKQQGERECVYKADFVYSTSDGMTVVEDAKGMRTREYIIKRKLMLLVHGIRVREV